MRHDSSYNGRPDVPTPYVSPRNDLERVLAGFWQDGLGIARVGVNDDFFELGGSSLLAIDISAQIRSLLAVDFLMADFVRRSTIASQAEAIAQTFAAHADAQLLGDPPSLPDNE